MVYSTEKRCRITIITKSNAILRRNFNYQVINTGKKTFLKIISQLVLIILMKLIADDAEYLDKLLLKN